MHLEFCHWLHINHQLLLLVSVLFTDEATFTHNRINNRSNSHPWCHNGSHVTVETNFQHCFSISVWCSMINDMLTGPVTLDNYMTGNNYLDFLQNGLPEQLEVVLWLHR
jgi:hypothetical protein